MASYRRPKGSVTRHPADWNSNNVAYTGLFSGGSGNGSGNLGLLNNDALGRVFVVWDCTISIGALTAGTAFTGNAVWEVAQAPVSGGGFTDPCAFINPFMGTPSGLVVSGFDVSKLDPNRAQYSALAGAGTWVWPHEFPMAILPVNYALIVEFGWTSANVNFGVLYEIARYA